MQRFKESNQSLLVAAPSNQAPIVPPKRNSKLMSPTEGRKVVNGSVNKNPASPAVNGHSEPTVTAPARKSYKKPIKRPDPTV